jgi:hypothetical protein
MPSGFPETECRALGLAAHAFLPKILSDEDLNDSLERLRQFDWARQAVRYRYRLCIASQTICFAVRLEDGEPVVRAEECNRPMKEKSRD